MKTRFTTIDIITGKELIHTILNLYFCIRFGLEYSLNSKYTRKIIWRRESLNQNQFGIVFYIKIFKNGVTSKNIFIKLSVC